MARVGFVIEAEPEPMRQAHCRHAAPVRQGSAAPTLRRALHVVVPGAGRRAGRQSRLRAARLRTRCCPQHDDPRMFVITMVHVGDTLSSIRADSTLVTFAFLPLPTSDKEQNCTALDSCHSPGLFAY